MQYAIPGILLALWLLGWLSGMGGAYIHLLLLGAVVAYVVDVWNRRRPRGPRRVDPEFKRMI